MGDMGTRAVGDRGEQLACEHLEARGWRIVERNWRCAVGEIDVVALDPAARCTVFVEVKCRTGRGYGDPLEAITVAKVRKLRSLIAEYLHTHEVHGDVRLDAIGIVTEPGRAVQITHRVGIGA